MARNVLEMMGERTGNPDKAKTSEGRGWGYVEKGSVRVQVLQRQSKQPMG